LAWAPIQGIKRIREFIGGELWDFESERRSQLGLVRLLQFCIMVARGFVRDRLLLRSSALAYFTVLSVVPLLAVAAAIANAIGVGASEFVESVVGTLAAGSPEVQQQIRERIAGANFAGLGALGAAVLFVTTVLAMGTVERSLNDIWGVKAGRSWGRRFPDYLAALTVGPLLGGAAISLSTTLQNEWLLSRMLQLPGFTAIYSVGLRQLPWVLLSLSLAFLYWFLPNTRVRPVSALMGGIPAGVLTLAAQNVYLDFNIGAVRANAFFGSAAALPLLFAWVYLFWAIVLFGAEIAFAHQNLHVYRREVRGKPAGPAERESIGLRLALSVARRFEAGAAALDASEVAKMLGVPVRTVRDVAAHLLAAGILSVRLDDAREDALQLGRPAERIRVTEVLDALRGRREALGGDPAVGGAIDNLLSEVDEGALKGAAGRTLADLLVDLTPA
jgi:membrane protein